MLMFFYYSVIPPYKIVKFKAFVVPLKVSTLFFISQAIFKCVDTWKTLSPVPLARSNFISAANFSSPCWLQCETTN